MVVRLMHNLPSGPSCRAASALQVVGVEVTPDQVAAFKAKLNQLASEHAAAAAMPPAGSDAPEQLHPVAELLQPPHALPLPLPLRPHPVGPEKVHC